MRFFRLTNFHFIIQAAGVNTDTRPAKGGVSMKDHSSDKRVVISFVSANDVNTSFQIEEILTDPTEFAKVVLREKKRDHCIQDEDLESY
jgi:hypothetical protein